MPFSKLTWGVKASFRSYVQGAGGSISLSDGATQTSDGAFIFTALPGGNLVIEADGTAHGSVRFAGTVEFEAHGGMLKSTLAEIGIDADGEGLFITVLEAPMNQGRCAIAKLEPVNGNAEFRSEITMDGMYQIADNYPPGTELDPVRLD